MPSRALLLIGPRFALLRPEFAGFRGTALRRDGSVRRILVSFGAVDAAGHSLRSVMVARRRFPHASIDVIVGTACPHIG